MEGNNVCLTWFTDQKAPLCRRNFSVSTAFTTTEEGAESPSAGVTFIADHPLLFSVLVKQTARCKWKVVVVLEFVIFVDSLHSYSSCFCKNSYQFEGLCTYKFAYVNDGTMFAGTVIVSISINYWMWNAVKYWRMLDIYVRLWSSPQGSHIFDGG